MSTNLMIQTDFGIWLLLFLFKLLTEWKRNVVCVCVSCVCMCVCVIVGVWVLTYLIFIRNFYCSVHLKQPWIVKKKEKTVGTLQWYPIWHVFQHIKARMSNLSWTVEEDSFEDSTPFGKKTFTNIIATFDPSRSQRIIVGCHYDSKDFKTREKKTFIGATDSAVPCAIMLETAKQLDCLLKKGPKDKSAVSVCPPYFVYMLFPFFFFFFCVPRPPRWPSG